MERKPTHDDDDDEEDIRGNSLNDYISIVKFYNILLQCY